MNNLSQQLQQLPQVAMPKNIFDNIQSNLHQKSYIKKHKFISFASIAAVLLLSVMFFKQTQDINVKDVLIQELVKRTMQLEQLLVAEIPTSTIPGSQITERIVNMEIWLAKLDKDIIATKDKRKLSKLMAAKLDILGNLVMLQRKINQKPDFQKVKPYII
ncbi:MAG: hypothetical protein L3J53_06195 [Proteobacteria bacterium]|nr:hypothetical protein [Pseudomonadota bacterium]